MKPARPKTPAETPGPAPVIRSGEDGRLLMSQRTGDIPAAIRPCFPWSYPRRFLSVRDDKGNELALIQNLEDLDETSRQAVETALKNARFTFDILAIDNIERDFELRVWKVRTRQGPRTFLIKLDDWPRELDDGSLVIRDLSGDSFRIAAPDALDKRSASLLYPYRK